MHSLSRRWGYCLAAAAMLIAASLPLAASADPESSPAATPPAAPAATATVLAGTVRSGTGLPVAGVAVKLIGSTRWTASGVQPLIGANGQPVVVDNNTALSGRGRNEK